jgi:hypothetical protein
MFIKKTIGGRYMSIGYIVINFLTGKPVEFPEVNNEVSIPVTKDPLRPRLIMVKDEYRELFIETIRKKGWYLRKITP